VSKATVNLLQAPPEEQEGMTPAWLSRPPSVGELLNHYRDPAQWRTRPVMNLPSGYGDAASLLLDSMIARASESPGTANAFIPPYLFLWRHCIELQLKEILKMVADNASQWTEATQQVVAPDLFSGRIKSSHKLQDLWERVRPLVETALQKPHHDWHLPALPLAVVAPLIEQLHQIDPGGDGVRYDRHRNGDLTMLGVNRIDLEHAQRNLFGIAEFLIWADREIGTTMGIYLSEAAAEEERRQQWEAMGDDEDDYDDEQE
jgi:hypothetical protein